MRLSILNKFENWRTEFDCNSYEDQHETCFITDLRDPPPSQICTFLTNVLCHNILWVRVMSIKVYIFGKEINRRIYLWPRILP